MRIRIALGLVTSFGLVTVVAIPALAADLPSRRAPPVFVAPPVAFSWTGFEAGLHSGYTFGSDNRARTNGIGTPATDVRPASLSTEKNGFAQVGAGLAYNYQFTPGSGFVIGAALDADWVDLHKDAFVAAPTGLSVYHQRLSILGTANGRIGYAFDRLLVYGTGGFAFGDPGLGANFFAPTSPLATRYIGGNNGQLKGGYDFGGGVAYAIPESSFLNSFAIEKYLGFDKLLGFHASTTLKVEYIHYNLGTQTITANSTGVAGGGGSYAVRYKTEGNQIRAGLVYSFGGAVAPVVARY